MADEDSYLSLIPTRKETPVIENKGGIRYAADLNNPTGLGWNGKTWNSYNSPEEGIKDSLTTITKYLSNQGPMSNVSATPENYIGTWVNGKPETGAQVQKGAYAKALRKQLKDAGIELLKGDVIPNTEEAKQALLKAHIVHENTAKHQSKFLDVLPKIQQTNNVDEQETPNYLSLLPKQPVTQEIQEREYQPGYFNPNLVAQGERARAAGGGNLEPMVSGITDAIKSMNIEDWKKESLLANMLKYGVGSMPIVGNEAMREEGRQKLLQTGEAALGAIANPIQTMQAIGEQEPGQLLGSIIKGGIYDAPLGLAAKPITNAAGAVVKPVLSTAGKVVEPIVESAANKFGTLQEAMQNVRKPSVTLEGANYRPDLDTQMSGVGAANANLTTQLEEAISRASPEKQNLLKQLSLQNLTEQDLKAIETHNKFDKFNMTPTEGQALQDITKMSDEFNARKQDPNLQARFEERDPKLIEGFNKIRETVAPDVYESNPAKLANSALDKLKQNYEVRTANEAKLYKKLEEANGGDFPMNVGELDKNIISSLKAKKSFRDVESHPMYQELKDQLATGKMSFDDFEHFRTRLSTAMRSAKDGNVRFGLGIIRDELENMPIPKHLSHLKPLADEARNAFKAHKELQKSSPAYQAAINDTRTADEILRGDLHPASNEFINKFYGPKTPQVEISRLLNELGIDSPEHQGLNAATIDKIKRASGVKGEFGNESGTISQTSLSDQLNKSSPNTYGNNLSTMFRQEHIKDLKDLSDVATLTEPRKGVNSVNTSNSEILAQENRAKTAAKETASKIGATVAEATVNAKLPGIGTIGRSILKGRAEQKALDLENMKKAEESKRRLSPIAGIGTKLQDIGKE